MVARRRWTVTKSTTLATFPKSIRRGSEIFHFRSLILNGSMCTLVSGRAFR